MESINDALAAILKNVRTPGDFYATGQCALHVPLIEIDGAGPIALPLLPAQAAQLIAWPSVRPTAAAAKPWSTRRGAGLGRSALIVSASRASTGPR